MSSTQILDHEHQQILEETRGRRLADERRFYVPGCPWQCEGGWRLVEDDEDQEPHFLDIIVGGKLYTPCECNSRLVLRDGRYQPEMRIAKEIKMEQISKICGHKFEHSGWPIDELCPDCFFTKYDTDEAYYRAEVLREQIIEEQAWLIAQRTEAT